MDTLSMTTTTTPVGELTLVAGATGLRAVLWPDERDGRVRLGAVTGGGPVADAVLAAAVEQLREYFAGERRDFDLPLDPVGTAFQQQAWHVLRTIPYGHTITYGEQARRLGMRASHGQSGQPMDATRSASWCPATAWWAARADSPASRAAST